MQRFFLTLFGGLGAILGGILIAYAGHMGWILVRPAAFKLAEQIPAMRSLLSNAASTVMHPADGTSISGFFRTVRYSADEEEDNISSAARSLPGIDKNITALAYTVKKISGPDAPVEHNADQLLPIASLTKLVTAVVAYRLVDPDTNVTISRDIMATYGNTAEFRVGETLKASDLYYPLLMVSSNDAAEALARSYGRAKFIRAMNDFTQSIGAYRTYFDDPSGLSPDDVSTANDLALILSWIRTNDPSIIDVTAQKVKTIRSHTWVNPTHFLNWSNYIGGKNGYIPEANRTGASLFTVGKDKDIYAVIVLGSDSRDDDELKLLKKVND